MNLPWFMIICNMRILDTCSNVHLLTAMQGLRIIFFICMVFLIVSQLFWLCKIDGAKIDKTKSKEPKEILKKMITDLGKCAKTNKNEANKLVQKCLSNFSLYVVTV